jgi:alanine racemase
MIAHHAQATVNLAAVERNCERLRSRLREGVALCAVVKADGYGHGAAESARAAVRAGASWLAVAGAEEACQLRELGFRDVRLLVMGALAQTQLRQALGAGAEVIVWSERQVRDVAAAGGGRVHVKLDTGMGRLGTRDERQALAVAEMVGASSPQLELAGAMTHFATADDDPEFMERQLEAFEPFVAELRRRWPDIAVHAANSAATLREPRSHFTLVRCGIAIYGCDPMHQDPDAHDLEPALELRSYVAAVKRAKRGDSAGYGRRFISPGETWIATVPIGYADGIRRALSNNCDVLIGGRRYPLVGTVSMDNITVDLGPEPVAREGEAATIIGRDGPERQRAEDLARRIGTISYEVLTGISRRVPRVYHRDGDPA